METTWTDLIRKYYLLENGLETSKEVPLNLELVGELLQEVEKGEND